MKIVTLYQTSKGLYPTINTANSHRSKINDPRAPNHGQREPVIPVSALCDGHGHFFKLTELVVDVI
jgi:hypothetical protein